MWGHNYLFQDFGLLESLLLLLLLLILLLFILLSNHWGKPIKASKYVLYSNIFHEPTVHIFQQHNMKKQVYKFINLEMK